MSASITIVASAPRTASSPAASGYGRLVSKIALQESVSTNRVRVDCLNNVKQVGSLVGHEPSST